MTITSPWLTALPNNEKRYQRARTWINKICRWKELADGGYETNCGFLWKPTEPHEQPYTVCPVCARVTRVDGLPKTRRGGVFLKNLEYVRSMNLRSAKFAIKEHRNGRIQIWINDTEFIRFDPR